MNDEIAMVKMETAFENGLIGFHSVCNKNELLKILPSVEKGYWFVTHFTRDDEHFLKRPVKFEALPMVLKMMGIRDFNLEAFQTKPLPLDEFTQPRIYGTKSKQSTNIYFIQPIEGGLVKIGSAVNVTDRLKQHQCGSPVLLRVVKVIPDASVKFEKELHRKFKQYHHHGEWFSPEVLEGEN